MNILPTKKRLRTRGIAQDGRCDLCGYIETSRHTLWGCKFASLVWGNTKIKLPSFEMTPRDFIDILWEIKNKKPELNWELFVVTAWSLWNNRNAVRHGG